MKERTCGSCTKCCEGHLRGEVKGHLFFPGKPCHFLDLGKGCTIYEDRPKDPCVSYKCGWLVNVDIPEWLKPDAVNVIIDYRTIESYQYINLIEAGATVSAKVLNWFIQFALNNQLNAIWRVEGEENWIGNEGFIKAVKESASKK
jgi:uncharacterized cysteine cluster protein YcgN (CxxCxxCC family)